MPAKRRRPPVVVLPPSLEPELITEPLFDMDPTPKKGSESKRAYLNPAGWVSCPRCTSLTRVAVMRDGAHLVYREHRLRTWNGTGLTCVASLQRLCDLAPRPGSLTPVCTCGAR